MEGERLVPDLKVAGSSPAGRASVSREAAPAGNSPTTRTDPSGQGWVFPQNLTAPSGDYQKESAIDGYAPFAPCCSANQPAGGDLQGLRNPATTGYCVPVFTGKPHCGTRVPITPSQVNTLTETANVLDTGTHQLWDIEHATVRVSGSLLTHLHQQLQDAQLFGYWVEDARCNRFSPSRCAAPVRRDPSLRLGTGYPGSIPGWGGHTVQVTAGVTGALTSFPGGATGALPGSTAADRVTVQVAPGLLEYAPLPLAPTCTGLAGCVVGLAQTLVFNDFTTLFAADAPWYQRAPAFVGVVGDVVWVAKLAEAGQVAVVLGHAGEAVDLATPAGVRASVEVVSTPGQGYFLE